MPCRSESCVIIDDNAIWVDGFVQALAARHPQMTLRYAGADPFAALIDVKVNGPLDIALVDAHLDDCNASQAAVGLLADLGVPVALISAHPEPSVVRTCLAAGAMGCVTKADIWLELDDILVAARSGRWHLTPTLTASLLTGLLGSDLAPAQRAAIQWHAAGIPIQTILDRCALARPEFDQAVAQLIADAHADAHGTDAS